VSAVDRELVRASRPARTHLASAVLLGAVAAALTVVQAALLAHVIAAAFLEGASPGSLTPSLVALAAVALGRGLVAAGFELSGRAGAARVMSDLRRRLVAGLATEGPAGRSREPAGALATTAVQGVDALQDYFARYLPQVVLAALVPIAILVFVATLDPVVAVVLAVTVPLIVVFMVLIGRGAGRMASARWQTLTRLSAHFLDVVEGLETLRAHAREDAQVRTLSSVGDRLRRETMATLRVAFLSALVLELAAMLGTALAAVTIGVQLVDGSIGLEAGLTVLLLAPELYAPLRQLGAEHHAAADGVAAARTLLAEITARPAGDRAAPVRRRAPDPAAAPVHLRSVTLGYPGRGEPVLQDVDLELAPRALTALVGPSGAGKTTLAALILRLLEPNAGEITCGGVGLAEVDPDAWREHIAWLPQHPTLFAASVADNVRLAVPQAPRTEIWRALRAARIDDVVATLPRGLDTRVGEGGRALSAGQAQRLGLARALIRHASLLVLDEPTAHLDEASAAAVGEAIEEAAEGRTTLLITHRGALAATADRVAELHAGRIRMLAPAPPALLAASAPGVT
jgi:ATP-binding cassette, subfamily C, bacterial CydD